MEKDRLKAVWVAAYQLFLKGAPELLDTKSSSEELEAEILNEKTAALARKCFWVAMYGISTIDNQYEKMGGRLKPKGVKNGKAD